MDTLKAALEMISIMNSGISNALHVSKYPNDHNNERLKAHIIGIVDRLNVLLEEMEE